MKYYYSPDTEIQSRWFKWTKNDEIRSYKPPKGWIANAELLDHHPVTGKPFKQSQWWIIEQYVRL